MGLCEANLTIVLKLSPTLKNRLVYLDEKNEIAGIFGSKINSILNQKASKITCKLIGHSELGIEAKNQTFSGALGLLQAGKGDLLFESLSQNLKKTWFEHSHASSNDELSI